MGIWKGWRRKLGTRIYGQKILRGDIRQEVQAAMADMLLINPALGGAIEGGSRGHSRGGGVEPLEQDFTLYLKSVGLFPWVTACVDAIATSGAAVPFKLMSGDKRARSLWRMHPDAIALEKVRNWWILKADGGRVKLQGNVEEVPEHDLMGLLMDPNPEQGWFEFCYGILQHLGMAGEGMVTAVGTPEETPFVNPEEIWAQRPDEMAPIYDKRLIRKGRGGSALVGWTQTPENGRTQNFPAEAVVMAKRPHPRDPIRGLAPIKRIECALNLLWSVLRANKAYLENGAGPGLVFKMGFASREMGERFEDKMEASHTGPSQRGKNLYLYGQNIELLRDRVMDTGEDAQYIELMRIVREWILAEYKCPPFAIGLLEHANWSNSVEQQQFFYQMAVQPALRLLFDSWNSSPFVQNWGDDLFLMHDYSGISALQPNRAEQMQSDAVAVQSGIQTINEIRALRGYGEPVEWGDEPPSAADPFASVADALRGRDDEDPEEDDEDDEGTLKDEELFVRDAAWQLIKAAKELEAEGKTTEAAALRWRAFANRSEPIERRWSRIWRILFRDLRATVLEEVNRRLATPVEGLSRTLEVPSGMGPLFDAHELAQLWLEAIEELARRTAQRGAEDIGQEITGELIPFPLDDPRVIEYLETQTASRIRTIAENRLAEVTKIVETAVADGVGVEELQTRLREHFDRNDITWSRRIARTETIGLYNQGAEAGLQDADIQTKRWLSSRDTSVRPSHSQMDGQEVQVGSNFTFESGASGPFPGQIDSASENINCRCTIIPGDT